VFESDTKTKPGTLLCGPNDFHTQLVHDSLESDFQIFSTSFRSSSFLKQLVGINRTIKRKNLADHRRQLALCDPFGKLPSTQVP